VNQKATKFPEKTLAMMADFTFFSEHEQHVFHQNHFKDDNPTKRL